MDKKESKISIRQLVSFKIAEEEFGVQITSVREIIRMQEITKVPRMPDFVEGMINLRGNIIPIIDLRKKFNLKIKDKDKDTRIMVVKVANKTAGFIVDAVEEVIRLKEDSIEPPPDIGDSVKTSYLSGIGKLSQGRMLMLVNLDNILSSEEHATLDTIDHNVSKANAGEKNG
ncbi:MAG: chemotaxis protein CheW [Elusimicrobia bacterium]|nr:chemotaxis protein CheW [Elusimicrobiota bacterium]